MRTSRERLAEWDASNDRAFRCLIPERVYRSLADAMEELRLWLPEPARRGLIDVCERFDLTMGGRVFDLIRRRAWGDILCPVQPRHSWWGKLLCRYWQHRCHKRVPDYARHPQPDLGYLADAYKVLQGQRSSASCESADAQPNSQPG